MVNLFFSRMVSSTKLTKRPCETLVLSMIDRYDWVYYRDTHNHSCLYLKESLWYCLGHVQWILNDKGKPLPYQIFCLLIS